MNEHFEYPDNNWMCDECTNIFDSTVDDMWSFNKKQVCERCYDLLMENKDEDIE